MITLKSSYRTHTCGELKLTDAGGVATLSGWVHRTRDHGGLLFIDLRDNYGMTQVVVDITKPEFKGIENIRSESVIKVSGNVVARDASVVNAKLPTGEIELVATSIKIIKESEVLPFQVFGDEEPGEEHRLKYRYLDLRRGRMHSNILFRNRVFKFIRDKMWDMGFSEFQTPILGATSPEGARDFIVPSRVHHGKVYALPQSPQQWKQLIQYSGFDRYFQLAPCFRDEDLRSDRLLEFYQLDMELSFVEQEDVMAVNEALLISLLQEFAPDGTWNTEIERIPYETAMLKYGSDKPDLRIPIEISDVSEIFRDSEFTIFADAVKAGKVVRAIPAPKTAGNPRSYFDKCEEFAKTELGLLGLGYIVFGEEEVKGPIAKKLTPEQIESIRVKAGVSKGDSIFFVCEEKTTAAKASGKLRKRFGAEIGLNPREFKICWIVDFPFYEKDEESGQIMFGHNPFGLPQGDIQNLDLSDPLALKAIQYDFVMNGEEIGGGGLRNYCRETMVKLFAIAGYDEQVIIDKFGGMYEVFKYGAIPTGGIAWGMERIVCLLLDEPNLREITAFPPNQKGQDLMMGSPNTPTEIQLRETHIQFRKKG